MAFLYCQEIGQSMDFLFCLLYNYVIFLYLSKGEGNTIEKISAAKTGGPGKCRISEAGAWTKSGVAAEKQRGSLWTKRD